MNYLNFSAYFSLNFGKFSSMKLALIIALTSVSFWSLSQLEAQELAPSKDGAVFFNFNLGLRGGGEKSNMVTMKSGLHLEGGVGYMFNHIVGIQGDLGFNTYKTTDVANPGLQNKSWLLRSSVQCVLSISEIAKFDVPHFWLNMHLGYGFSTHSNPSWKKMRIEKYGETFNDPAFKGNDDMVNVIFGINPKYALNEKLAVNFDFSTILQLKQDYTVDTYNLVKVKGLTHYFTFSTGLTYTINKKKPETYSLK